MAGPDPLRGVCPSPTAANPGGGRRSTVKRRRVLIVVGVSTTAILICTIAFTLAWAYAIGFKPPVLVRAIPEELNINHWSPAGNPSVSDHSASVTTFDAPQWSSQASSHGVCQSETDGDASMYTDSVSGAAMAGFSAVTASLLKCGMSDKDPRGSAVGRMIAHDAHDCVPAANPGVGCDHPASCESAASPATATSLASESCRATAKTND